MLPTTLLAAVVVIVGTSRSTCCREPNGNSILAKPLDRP